MSKQKKALLSSEVAMNAHYAFLGLGDISQIKVENPLIESEPWHIERPDLHIVSLLSDPNYFSFTCKHILNVNLLPVQAAILREMWSHPFPMLICSRGFGKSFMMGIYCLLKMLLVPGTKIVICGAAFRQSKIVFDYMETIWRNAPVLRDIAGNSLSEGPKRDTDRCTFRLCGSQAVAIPIGDGQKIRGLRANTIIVDEFGSVNPEIYETVISGFAAVSSRPYDNVQNAAKKSYLDSVGLGEIEGEKKFDNRCENQAILSGTADYAYSHFGKYHSKYKQIIETRGDRQKLAEIVGEEDVDKFNWKDFCVVRIPYEIIPEGFMDKRHVSRARATVENSVYLMEYGACFPDDSNGFFKRSLIDGATTSQSRNITTPTGLNVFFDAVTKGNVNSKYVFGIDPASERDNFAIVVLEVFPDHNRVVYVWTTNRKDFNAKKSAGLIVTHDFYGFCARKIRDLMKVFPCERIGIDAQGGGIAVEEALHDPDKLQDGEVLLWPVIDENKEKPTDGMGGSHILEMINFASADWTSRANHGLKKDMEDKALLFPEINSVTLALALDTDARMSDENRQKMGVYDMLEECMLEVEELKRELSTVIHSITDGGRERWDTPEVKNATGKKGRLRKDRYSALVIANSVARNIQRGLPNPLKNMPVVGGFAHDIARTHNPQQQQAVVYPDWYKSAQNCNFGRV